MAKNKLYYEEKEKKKKKEFEYAPASPCTMMNIHAKECFDKPL